ncbi:SPX domain-containing inorganic phosphate transporter [Saccharomyces pastorianus]|uniref:SPX domain-containing inorganic phosphate transporter n=1 Tax=Saccharomyces pastorianus TaxID=27292 RepID=A0A6C1E966_SACPS|nr:PHO90-like protein [Saccharomyces eubayanus]KOG98428.1 PHO90-like protein [Saccharomyces eubayanus]QID85936.1 SPX domain-containing inorganic phosphate transporter [Saccharomyces pastorianus]
MRFSHFLKYNAVPEWQSHYMDYSDLKNLIYTLQTDELQAGDNEDGLSGAGKSPTIAGRFKNKFSFKNGKEDAPSGINKDAGIVEETIELRELPKVPTSGAKSSGPFRRMKEKIFDKRRSSSVSSASSTTNETPELDTYHTFVTDLTGEKLKVDDFYKRTEAKFYEKFDALVKDLKKIGVIEYDVDEDTLFSEPAANGNANEELSPQDLDDDEEDDDEFYDNQSNTEDNTALLHHSQYNIKSQKRSLLKKSIVNLYIDLCQLKSFIELNRIGFAKITKKSDKVLRLNTRVELIESEQFFKDAYAFQADTLATLNSKISELVTFYAAITDQPHNIPHSKQELKSYLHDHIVWERSNTWKDMLGLLSQTDELTPKEKEYNAIKLVGKLDLEYYRWPLPKPINLKFTTINNFTIPKLFFTRKAYKIYFIILVTGLLLGIKTFNDPAQHRCMALVECVAFLWASEAIPLHITAFLVPLLAVLFKVLKTSDGSIMGAASASSEILAAMWSSTIMILLAGFTLGEVLAQYNIAKVLASWLLAFAGCKPRNVLLMAMCVVFFLSMWISNVAAPVLTYSLLSPLLDTMDADSPFAQALVLGVALGANIGGMASPISSPQNIISMAYLKPYGIGWGQFFAVALPSGILAMLLAWILLFTSFKMNKTKLEKFEPIRTKFTIKQYYIIAVTVATILLWCVESQIEGAFGSSGQIAIIPIVLFFGTGLLSTQDLNAFPWSIVILAMGGIALGKAVSSSGLLSTIARALQKKIENDGVFAILCIFGILMLVVGTFVSHTVSAIIIIPLVKEVGDKLDNPKAAPILVFGCALLSSCGMGLASSGFPNVTAISKVDRKGDRYLSVMTFLTRGVPASILAFLCIITLGYGIMASVLKGTATSG